MNYFASESVTKGHPDKIADQISDAVLDAFLTADADSRVACEVLVNTGLVVVSGEVRSRADFIDIQSITRQTILDIGYNQSSGFDGNNCAVLTAIDEQSSDIAQGVDATKKHQQGAGDQGLMFGYACQQTKELMPLPITLAHRLTTQLTALRETNKISWLRPDGKAQVVFRLDDNGRPVDLQSVVVSTQHLPTVEIEEIRETLKTELIEPVCSSWLTKDTEFFINPTGKFVIGGPPGDCGLTGRKIIVDTYGGWARHGGGCFSGKDPSKVDRSGAYMARFLAKNVVANGWADQCEIQLSYAIGRPEPTGLVVQTFGTNNRPEAEIAQFIRTKIPLRPAEIIEFLDLKKPQYLPTASGGHFGRVDKSFPWEQVVTW